MNPNTHFYLYAKDWYIKSQDVMDDLKEIMADYAGIEKKYVQEKDVIERLLSIVYYEMNKSRAGEYFFISFLSNSEQVGFVEAALSVLRCAKMTNEKIGRPDERILELRYSQEEMNNFRWSE